MKVKFTWDDGKAAENLVKHGISFDAAKLVFNDPNLFQRADDFPDEDRVHAIGFADQPLLLLVIHTETYANQDQSVIRIISARPATKRERKVYWQALQG